MTMKKCKFTLGFSDEIYDGYFHGTYWNGFENISVKASVFNKLKAKFPDDFTSVSMGKDGLFNLSGGYATSMVEEDTQ